MLLGISCIYINIHFFNGDSLYSILLLYFLQIEALHNSGHCQGVKKGVKKMGGWEHSKYNLYHLFSKFTHFLL